MSAVLAFFKFIYEQKEKLILGVLVVVFAGVAFVHVRAKKDSGSKKENAKNSPITGRDKREIVPPREPSQYRVPVLGNKYSLETYLRLIKKKDIFKEPEIKREKPERGLEEKIPRWAGITIKSIFDPTRSGSYIAIIEVDKRRRFVREGEQFGEYEVRRIDGVRNCLTIVRRGTKGEGEEKEFCKKD